MMIEKIIPWAISFCSLLFAIWSGTKKDVKGDTATIATIVTKLEGIEKGINIITQENKDFREDFNDLKERVLALEIRVKDMMEERVNGGARE